MVWVSSLLSQEEVLLAFLTLPRVFIPALGRSGAGECLKQNSPVSLFLS